MKMYFENLEILNFFSRDSIDCFNVEAQLDQHFKIVDLINTR